MDLIKIIISILMLASAPLLHYLLNKWKKGGYQRRYHISLGSGLQMKKNLPRIHDYITDLSRGQKTFRISMSPFRSDVLTNDPMVVEHILHSNFDNYGKGTFQHSTLHDLLGNGIFAVDGATWRHQRKLASHEFSAKAIKEFSAIIFKKKVILLANIIAKAADSQSVIDLQELLLQTSMESIFEVSFGSDLGILNSTRDEMVNFLHVLDTTGKLIIDRFFDPLWKLKRFFNMGPSTTMMNNIRIIDDYLYKLIQAKKTQISGDKRDFMSRFLLEREKDPEKISDRYIRDIIISFLIAGLHTTAGTLAWFFYFLCKRPDVEHKLLEEIKRVVKAPEVTSPDEFLACMTDESIIKMTYLHATLVETLRLYPPIAADGKICFKDDILPDGCAVRAGEMVQYLPYSMGRMKYLWGEDAEVFRPERWIGEDGSFCPESPFKFTAFQAGPRICLGKEYAYRQMKIFAAVLIRFFTFKLRNNDEKAQYKLTFTLLMDPGLHVYAFRR